MKRTYGLLALAVVSMVVFPRHAFAGAKFAGLSPASFDMVIYRGDVLSEIITVMGSGSSGDLPIEVSVKNGSASLLDVRGQDLVVIPDGSDSMEFSFDIDARNAEIGTYEDGIIFVFDPETEGVGQIINMAATSKVRISVEERPGPETVLSVSDYQTLPDDVSFSNLKITQSPIERGMRLRLTWDTKSSGANPLRGAEVEIGLYRGTDKENGMTRHVVNDIPVNRSSVQSFDIDLLEPKTSGRYLAEISYDGKTLREEAWVIQPSLSARLKIMLAASVALAGVLSWLVVRTVRKTKSSRRSKR